MKTNVITILGRAGSGKGTQAKLLTERFGFDYFGSGDSLRKRRQASDFTAKKLFLVMEKGELVPSFIISKLWIDALEGLKSKSSFKGLILDGTPRKILEARLLDDALDWYEWDKNLKVVLIDISNRESFNRLTKRRQCAKCKRLIPWVGDFRKLKKCDKCNGELRTRTDDKPAAIKKRLEEYRKEVIPVIRHYQKQKKLIKIDGEQPIEDVFKDILKALR